MAHSIDGKHLLARYGAPVVALFAVLGVAAWPAVLVPLVRAYLHFSVRYLRNGPFDYHYPPFVIAAAIVWGSPLLLVVAVLLVRQMTGQHRLSRGAARRQVALEPGWARLAEEIGIRRRLVVVDDQQVYAFCAGLFFPSVYISQGLFAILDADEIEAVLRHEANHFHRRDPLRLFVAQLLHIALSPFPVAATMCDRIRFGVELRADRAALALVPLPVLASALVKVARAASAPRVVPLAAGLTASEARIDALLGKTVALPFARRDLFLSCLVVATIVVAMSHLAGLRVCHICPTL